MVLSDATLLTLESAVQSLSDDYLASRSAALQHCVRRLKGRQRQTVELRYLKELTVELLLSELASNAGSQRDSRRLTATTAVREESISKTGDLLYD